MKTKEIVERITNALNIEDAVTITAEDFTEEREPNMIVVGISNADHAHDNPFVPDYEYDLSIVVDTFIDADPTGALFEKTVEEVQRILAAYAWKEKPLGDLFIDIPVVGFWEDGEERTIDNKSYRATLSYKVVASF